LEKTNNKQKNESDVSRGSRVSSANEIRFTEIKPRSLPAKSAVTTGSSTSSEIAVSSVKRFLKKTQTESSLSFDIKDVDKNQNTFKSFVEDCRNNSFSFSVALEKRRPTGSTIGRKFNKGSKPVRQKPRLAIEGDNLIVVGVAVCWGEGDVCFLSLENEESDEVSWQMKMESLRDIMALHVDKRVKTAFGIKEQFKVGLYDVPALSQYLCFMLCLFIHNLFQVLSRACGVVLKGELHDPKIAAWLLDPGAKEKNFLQMVEHFLPQESNLLQGIKTKSRHRWRRQGRVINI
jgi:DNA polymerase theta